MQTDKKSIKNQSKNRSIIQSVNQSINKSTNPSNQFYISQLINQLINELPVHSLRLQVSMSTLEIRMLFNVSPGHKMTGPRPHQQGGQGGEYYADGEGLWRVEAVVAYIRS